MSSYKDYLSDVDGLLKVAKAKATKFIECNIWNEISYGDLTSWLGNFNSDEEKLIAVFLLDNLSFKSNDQIKALISHALKSCMPSCFSNETLEILSSEALSNTLITRKCSEVLKIVPVIRDIDPPTKSGPSVARLYKRLGRVNENNMIWPWQIPDAIKQGFTKFVFIDDTLATGEQFIEFCDRNVKGLEDSAEFGYIPMVAHDSGILAVTNKYPGIKISPVELADQESNFFDKARMAEIDDLRDLYDIVSKKVFTKNFYQNQRYGYGKLSMTLGFAHSTPNATLPMYWYSSENYNPLMRR